MNTIVMAELGIETERFDEVVFSETAFLSMSGYILGAQHMYHTKPEVNDRIYLTALNRQAKFAEGNPEVDEYSSMLALLVNSSRFAREYLMLEWRRQVVAEDKKSDPSMTLQDRLFDPFKLCLPSRFTTFSPITQELLSDYFIWPNRD